jgi:hypothetical protein
MQQLVPLKFKSERCEREVRFICAAFQIPFETLEEAMNRKYVFVPQGNAELSPIDIGRDRLMECPSEALDKACKKHAEDVTGLTKARMDGDRRLEQRELYGFPEMDPSTEEMLDMFKEWRRERLPPSVRRELAKLDHKRKIKRRLQIVE